MYSNTLLLLTKSSKAKGYIAKHLVYEAIWGNQTLEQELPLTKLLPEYFASGIFRRKRWWGLTRDLILIRIENEIIITSRFTEQVTFLLLELNKIMWYNSKVQKIEPGGISISIALGKRKNTLYLKWWLLCCTLQFMSFKKKKTQGDRMLKL